MLIKIGLENGFEGKSIAWILDYPGCFATGAEGSEAILKVPQALVAYQDWIADHTPDSWLADLGNFDVRLAEVLGVEHDDTRWLNWFQDDARPLSEAEVEHGLLVLEWMRSDLLFHTASLKTHELDQPFEGEQWSIRGILDHLSNAEYWYLGRLGLAGLEKSALSADVFERLAQVRARLNEVLPQLAGSTEVRTVDGVCWSARKVLRRAVWHEKDHIQHILRLMTLL
jgi:hypothetical protein